MKNKSEIPECTQNSGVEYAFKPIRKDQSKDPLALGYAKSFTLW